MVGNLVKYGGLMVVVFLIAFLMTGQKPAEVADASKDQYEVAVKERHERGRAIANYLSRYSIDPMLVGGDERDILLEEMISRAKSDNKDVLYVSISDKRGKILAHTDPSKVGQSYSPPDGGGPLGSKPYLVQTLESPGLGRYYDAGVGIMLGNAKIGEVHAGLKAVKEPKPPEGSASAPKTGIFIAFAVGIIGVVGLSLLGRGAGGAPAALIDGEKREQLKREEDALMKRITEIRNDEETQRQNLEKLKRELADVTTQMQARKNELAQLGTIDASKVREEVGALREEATVLQRRLETLKASEASIVSSIQKKKEEDASLAKTLEAKKTAAQTRGSAQKEDAELAQRLEGKKREELSLTMRIVSKRREEIAISQRLEAKRKEEIELLRRLEAMRKQLGKPG